MKKKRYVSVAAVLLFSSLATGSAFATPFTPLLDEFWIVKDSIKIFEDSFTDNLLPPNGPDGTDTYAIFGAEGITDETAGKLTMTPSLGEPTVITTTYADLSTSGKRKLATNSANPNFLGYDNSFEIHGLFDMSNLPMVTGQSFGILASDQALTLGNEGNNTFGLLVGVHSTTNEVGVFLREFDYTTNTSQVLWSTSIASLLPNADQIELTLFKGAGSNMLNASFSLYDIEENTLGSGLKNDAGDIYNGENYILAQFTSSDRVSLLEPIPEPATMLLFGTGIAGLAGTRLRKKKSA